MASPSLALPGTLFVGEDERARLVAHLGPAAGWMIPKGILGWSTEVSVVSREALTEAIRRDAKIVMPEEQIAAAKMPLTHQAALRSPIVALAGRLPQKLVESGARVHTIGADRVTSSFYYIAEGGGEAPIRVEGDLVAAVGAMLGDRADNAAIERVLDGLVDRLLRSLSKDRVSELSLELAAALPRAASDGTGTQDLDLDAFEKELASLVGSSEKYTPFLEEIAAKLTGSNERKVEIPLFVDARKVSQGPFELTVGEQTVSLVTHERWLATGPLTEPTKAAPKPQPAPAAAPATPAAPVQRAPEPAAKAPSPKPAPVATTPAAAAPPAQAKPLNPPRPASTPPGVLKDATPAPAAASVEAPKPTPAVETPKPAPAVEAPKPALAEPVKAAPAVEAPKAAPAEPVKAASTPEATASERAEPTPEPAKAEPKKEAAPKTKVEEPAASKGAKPKDSKKDLAKEPSASDGKARDARLATTQKIERKEKGFPWLWVLLFLAAALGAAYRFGFIPH